LGPRPARPSSGPAAGAGRSDSPGARAVERSRRGPQPGGALFLRRTRLLRAWNRAAEPGRTVGARGLHRLPPRCGDLEPPRASPAGGDRPRLGQSLALAAGPLGGGVRPPPRAASLAPGAARSMIDRVRRAAGGLASWRRLSGLVG